jgi:hypothetical protein
MAGELILVVEDNDLTRAFLLDNLAADDHLNRPSCRFPQRGIPLLERAVALRGARSPRGGHDGCNAVGTNAAVSSPSLLIVRPAGRAHCAFQ